MRAETAIIDELMTMAQDRTRKGRRLLVQNITDLYISDDARLNDHERALMSEILCKLMQSIEEDVRRELALRLSDIEHAPAELIVLLGRDEIDVARPILEKSRVLKDPDLIEIVRQRTDEHRMAIAIRSGISSDVADALLAYGDEDVIEKLLRNADAALSRSAMAYLVAESERIDRFQEPLIARGDLPPEFANRMFWWVSAALRRHILLNFKIDQGMLDKAVETATHAAIARNREIEGARDKAMVLALEVNRAGKLDLPFLFHALRQERTALFVAGLAVLADLPIEVAWRIFGDRGGESLTVVMRAIGVGRAEFASLFLLIFQARSGGQAQDTSILRTIIELYDRIDSKTAEQALTYWRRDTGYQSALDDLEAN